MTLLNSHNASDKPFPPLFVLRNVWSILYLFQSKSQARFPKEQAETSEQANDCLFECFKAWNSNFLKNFNLKDLAYLRSTNNQLIIYYQRVSCFLRIILTIRGWPLLGHRSPKKCSRPSKKSKRPLKSKSNFLKFSNFLT